MRVLAGAVVVFAGALLFAGAALAEALVIGLARTGPAAPRGGCYLGYLLGFVLVAFGLYMIVRAWLWDVATERITGMPRGKGNQPVEGDAQGS